MINNNLKINHQGFTLIEVLLYMGLSVILVALVGGIGVNVISSLSKSKSEAELQYNTNFIDEKLRTVISSSDRILSPESGNSSTSLALEVRDSLKNPTVLSIEDGKLFIKEGLNSSQVLTGRSINVDNGMFYNVSYADSSESARVELMLRLNNPPGRQIYRGDSTVSATINLQ